MVPYDICTLRICYINSLKRILNIKCIGIIDKKGIEMSKRLAAGDFRTFDNDKAKFISLLLAILKDSL